MKWEDWRQVHWPATMCLKPVNLHSDPSDKPVLAVDSCVFIAVCVRAYYLAFNVQTLKLQIHPVINWSCSSSSCILTNRVKVLAWECTNLVVAFRFLLQVVTLLTCMQCHQICSHSTGYTMPYAHIHHVRILEYILCACDQMLLLLVLCWHAVVCLHCFPKLLC